MGAYTTHTPTPMRIMSYPIPLLSRKISKKHQLRIDTPWLDPNKSLLEQEVTEEDTLLLMYRFYYNMDLQG